MIFDTLFTFSQIRRIEKTLRRTLESLPEVHISSYTIAFSSLKCIVYNAIKFFYVYRYIYRSISRTVHRNGSIPTGKGLSHPLVLSTVEQKLQF